MTAAPRCSRATTPQLEIVSASIQRSVTRLRAWLRFYRAPRRSWAKNFTVTVGLTREGGKEGEADARMAGLGKPQCGIEVIDGGRLWAAPRHGDLAALCERR